MKFTCEKLLLLAAIVTASRAAAGKSPVPVLEGLLIETYDGEVRVVGYDLKMAIVTSLPAEIEESGGIVLNAKLFIDIVRKMPGQYITLSQSSGGAVVSIISEVSEFEILGSPMSDYPELPVLENEESSFEIEELLLKTMISQTNFAVSDNETRPIHTGALFEVGGGQLTVVAVDGYRLALRRESMDGGNIDACLFVVPGSALGEVEKIISGDKESLATVTLGEKHIMFTIGGTVLITRRLEGEFLNYKGSIPKSGKYNLRVEKEELIHAVERVSLIISDKLKSPVRCVFGDGIVRLYSMSALGKAQDECAIVGNGEDLEIGFNNRYLTEALRAAPSQDVMFEVTAGTAPCVITPTDGTDKFLYMILPVRLKTHEN